MNAAREHSQTEVPGEPQQRVVRHVIEGEAEGRIEMGVPGLAGRQDSLGEIRGEKDRIENPVAALAVDDLAGTLSRGRRHTEGLVEDAGVDRPEGQRSPVEAVDSEREGSECGQLVVDREDYLHLAVARREVLQVELLVLAARKAEAGRRRGGGCRHLERARRLGGTQDTDGISVPRSRLAPDVEELDELSITLTKT